MGKGNLLQGMGRGKLGDTVFYRQNGSQMFRVRNRMVKNPKSVGQQIQRSLMATITKAYSQLRVICDHSFENVAYGSASQSYFVKKNLDLLRKAAVTYTENNLSGIGVYNMPYIVAPGSVATVCPNKLIISEGSLQQTAFTFEGTEGDKSLHIVPSVGVGGTIKAFLDALGDKMFTLVVVRANSPILGTKADKQGQALWGTEVLFSRIKRNDVQLTSEDASKTLDATVIKKYINIETNIKSDDNLYNWFEGGGQTSFGNNNIAGCVIASKFYGGKWLRSSESLVVNKSGHFDKAGAVVKTGSAFGLDFSFGLGLWTKSNISMVTSDKLLNGGKAEANQDSFRPVE